MDNRTDSWNLTETITVAGSERIVSRVDLMRWVFDSAEGLVWSQTDASAGSASPAVLRSVVLYCLALGICASEEIIESSEADPAVRYLRANQPMDWPIVHEYRKRNAASFREALRRILGAVLPQNAESTRMEADVRLQRAVRADSYVLDL